MKKPAAKPPTVRPWYVRCATALVALLLAYGSASWAIDSGRILAYVLTFVLVGVAVQQLVAAGRRR